MRPRGDAGPVTVVVATRDRVQPLRHTLDRLGRLPERPPVVVVDNASADAAGVAAAAAGGGARLIRLDRNLGAVARNVGVLAATTPLVAFSDDDSWWEPGALGEAAGRFGRSPGLAVLQARILVGPARTIDPACTAMSRSPLPTPPGEPDAGPALLGFIACGAVVRRRAFLAAGGFSPVLFFLGEEQLLAVDLAVAGWYTGYADDVVACHHPGAAGGRDPVARRRLQSRNALLTTWMRRPIGVVRRHTARARRVEPAAVREALRRLPAALRRRRPVPPAVEAAWRLVEDGITN